MAAPHAHYDVKQIFGRPPEDIPSISAVLEQLKPPSSKIFSVETSSIPEEPSISSQSSTRLIEKKKQIILRRINSRSSNHETTPSNPSSRQNCAEPNVASSVDFSIPNRKVWNKAPIPSLLEQLSSIDVDAVKTLTRHSDENVPLNDPAIVEPQEDINMKVFCSTPREPMVVDNPVETEDGTKIEALQSNSTSLPNLNNPPGNNVWLLKEWVSMDSIFQRPFNVTTHKTSRRAGSLEVIRESFPEKDTLCRRYSFESIPTLTMDPRTRTPEISFSSTHSTLTYTIVNSLEIEDIQDFHQTTAQPQELFDSRKYTPEEPLRRRIRRSNSEPSISNPVEEYGSAMSLSTTDHSSWYSLFEDATSNLSQEGSSGVPQTPEQQELEDQTPITSPQPPTALHQQSSVTDSGFTTSRETPQPHHIMSPTPIPSESEPTPSMHTVLLQLLEEADGEGTNTDFAEEEDEVDESESQATLVAEGDEEEENRRNTSSKPSRFFIAEQMRVALENTLDLETLIKCYNVMLHLQESEDDDLHTGHEMIASIVGQNRANEVFDRILQLVLADGAFIDDDF